MPSDGYMTRIIQELAGLGGDVNFVKHEEEFQINKSLIYDTVRISRNVSPPNNSATAIHSVLTTVAN